MRRFLARLRSWMFPRAADAEMAREMDSHLALLEEAAEREGLPPAAARRAARLRYGSVEAAAERHRETRSFAWLEQLGRDTRHAARSLRRAPAFTLAAVATLALGLGANIAIFTVVNSVLLEPLPYPDSGRLVALHQIAPGAGSMASTGDGLELSLSMYVTYAGHNRSFSALGVWSPGMANVTHPGQPEQVHVVQVSDGVLEALAVPPLLGRWLGPEDQDPHRAGTAMLSDGYWQRRFGGDPHAIGQTLTVNGTPRTIVGIMPRGFQVDQQAADLIVPLQFDRGKLILASFGYEGLARLKPGATVASANADLKGLLPVWMDSWSNGPGSDPHFYQRWRITPDLLPLKQHAIGSVAGVLWAVMGTLALVMLIAAGNVVNLFLVRAETRQQELAVRAALGAGRARIAQSLLLEALLIAAAGGGLGFALAAAALDWVRAFGPANLPRLAEIGMDFRVLLFGLALVLLTAVAAGLIPAWKLASPRLSQALSSESRGSSPSRGSRRTRTLLSVGQVALALVLLLAAGLLIRTLAQLRAVQPGFSGPQTLQTFRISIPPTEAASDLMVMRTENNIVDRLAAIPGVRAVGLADQMPMENVGSDWDIVVKQGTEFLPNSTPPTRRFDYLSPGYLAAAGTRLVAGRDFTWDDLYALHRYLLVSQNLAQEFWGSPAAAIGKQISPGGPGNWYQVIGVVEDVSYDGVDKPAPSTVYWPALAGGLWGNKMRAEPDVVFALRTTRAGTSALFTQVRQAVAAINPSLPVASYRTMATIYDRSLAVPSFTMVMLALAGAMALLLGLIGIYGVIAYDVSRRQREVGIRMALGAERGEVRAMFVRQGLRLALVGGAIGLAAGWLVAQALRSLLFGVAAHDPLTFVAAPLLLCAAVLVASYLPARRASNLDPARVLKD